MILSIYALVILRVHNLLRFEFILYTNNNTGPRPAYVFHELMSAVYPLTNSHNESSTRLAAHLICFLTLRLASAVAASQCTSVEHGSNREMRASSGVPANFSTSYLPALPRPTACQGSVMATMQWYKACNDCSGSR